MTPAISSLSPEQIRVIIAEACGWTFKYNIAGGMAVYTPEGMLKSRGGKHWVHLPNYPSDLNACAEMEKVLTEEQLDIYVRALVRLQKQGGLRVFMSSPLMRCRAFLVALGKVTI